MAARVPLAALQGGPILIRTPDRVFLGVGAAGNVYTHDAAQIPANLVTVFAGETGGATLAQPLIAGQDTSFPGYVSGLVPVDIAVTWTAPDGSLLTETIEANPVFASDVASTGGGMVNPMTTAQDLIVGGTVLSGVAAPARLGVGVNGQVLGVSSGTVQWVSPAAAGNVIQLTPSGDTTGATDDANFAAACASLAAIPDGGEIQLIGSDNRPFYTKNTAGTYTGNGWAPLAQQPSTGNVGAPMSIQGIGRPRLCPVGAAKTGIYYHRTDTYGNVAQSGLPAQHPPGYIRNVIIDGVNATGASVGIDVGDGYGHSVEVWCVNFAGNNAIGAHICNRNFWTEKGEFRFHTSNCTSAVVVEKITGASSTSFEYCDIDVTLFGYSDQDGVVLQGNASLGGCRLRIRGNMSAASAATPPNATAAALKLLGSCKFWDGQIWAKVENNFSSSNPLSFSVYSDGTGVIQKSSGHIFMGSLAGSSMNGAEHSFSGMTDSTGSSTTMTSWAATNGWPVILDGQTKTAQPSGTLWTNLGPDAYITIHGGAGVSSIQVNGSDIGSSSQPAYLWVGAGGTLKIVFSTTAPSVTFIDARPG